MKQGPEEIVPVELVSGHLEIGTNDQGEVVVNHPLLITDEKGVGHIVFSPRQARALARLLLKHADFAEYKRYKNEAR